MPVKSEAQRKAMWAAVEGHSTLGIPKDVGEKFVGKTADDMSPDDWDELRALIVKWLSEEEAESDHAEDDRKVWDGVVGDSVVAWENYAMDRAPSQRSYDVDGRMHVKQTNISKANICEYLGAEIPDFDKLGLDPTKKYKLLRDPDELKKAADTFNGLPLLTKHVPLSAAKHHKELTVGATGTHATYEHPYLKNDISIWPQEAIDGVEDHSQKELSSAYRYRADMQPGTYEGEAYDGVMRDIVGNHVAAVKEGRAGADVVVGDSKPEENQMTKEIYSRKGAQVLGALMAFLKPKVAMDAKNDLAPILRTLTQANFKTNRPKIVAAVAKIAKDASIDDLTCLLDALEGGEVREGADTDPNTGVPQALPKKKEEMLYDEDDYMDALDAAEEKDRDGLEEEAWNKRADDAKAKLGRDEDPEEMEAREKAQGAKDAAKKLGRDESPEEMKMREEKRANDRKRAFDKKMGKDKKFGKDKKAGKDAAPEKKPDDKDEEMVSKAAMDEAIEKAVKTATTNATRIASDIREAERVVRPYVGEMPAMSFDSAEGVYRRALVILGQDAKEVNVLPLGALKIVLKSQTTQKEKQRGGSGTRIAQDSAASSDYNSRFPNAARIGL